MQSPVHTYSTYRVKQPTMTKRKSEKEKEGKQNEKKQRKREKRQAERQNEKKTDRKTERKKMTIDLLINSSPTVLITLGC